MAGGCGRRGSAGGRFARSCASERLQRRSLVRRAASSRAGTVIVRTVAAVAPSGTVRSVPRRPETAAAASSRAIRVGRRRAITNQEAIRRENLRKFSAAPASMRVMSAIASTLLRSRFRAMGTGVELLLDAGEASSALAAAEAEFHRLERILTRFRPDSDLMRLNAGEAPGTDPDLVRVVELALAAHEATGGRFDPTLHDALVASGYDRSFELLPAESDAPVASVPRAGGTTGVRVLGGEVRLEPGVRLDLGGIGKGYACERAAEILATAGPCLVNAGGDIATRGGSWTVGIETSAEPLTLELGGGEALATSGRDLRRWRRGGRELHHLLDPRTCEPSDSDLLRVTVVAHDAVDAEVAAKTLFLAGACAAAAEADELGLPAVLVTAEGETILAGGLA